MSVLDFGGYGFPSQSILCRSCQFHFIDAYPVALDQAPDERLSLFSLASLIFNLLRYYHVLDYFIPQNVIKTKNFKLHLLYSYLFY